jgi:lysyl-tRNA synthetase class 2
VPSTVIRSFEYDPDRRELKIVFQSGRGYRYSDVPPEIPVAMRAAARKGEYFNREIRGAFPFVVDE